MIREEFILSDGFSGTFDRFLSAGESAASKIDQIGQASARMESTMRSSIGGATGAIIGNMRQIGESSNTIASSGFGRLEAQLDRVVGSIEQMEKSTNRINVTAFQHMHRTLQTIESDIDRVGTSASNKIGQADAGAKRMLSTIARIVSVAAMFKLGGDLIGLSDSMTQVNARLGMIVDNSHTVSELNDLIYQSANRARASYQGTADAVSQISQRAGDVFGNNTEAIQFVENLNKQFAIAGTRQTEISSATQQLTQALGAGALRGEELNSIFEAAPNIIQTIADYLGVSIGEIKELASDGQITAEIIKNAMLSATDEINANFEEMPMTWAQAAVLMKNAFIYEFDEVLAKINDFINSDTGQQIVGGIIAAIGILSGIANGAIDLLAAGADFIVEHWDYIYPVLIGIAAAFLAAGVLGFISGLVAMAGWSPLMFIIIGIGVAVAAAILVLKQMGVSWETMGAVAGGVLGALYSFVRTVVAYWWNLFASFAEFFANVWNDPVTAVANLFHDLFDNVLQLVETAASAIDKLLGTDMAGAVSGFRGRLEAWVTSKYGENQVHIDRIDATDVGEEIDTWSKKGGELGKQLDELNFNMDDFLSGGGSGGTGITGIPAFGGDLGDIGRVGSVGKIEEDVSLSDEDLKMMKDLTQRQYVSYVNLTLPQTNVSVNQTVQGGDGSDIDMIAGALKNLLLTQSAASVN